MDKRYSHEGGYFKHRAKLKSPKKGRTRSPNKSPNNSPANRFNQLRELYRKQTKELHTLKGENQRLREILHKLQNPQ